MTLQRLYARILNMVAPGTLTFVSDGGTVMRAQVRIGGTPQTLEGVPVLQHYGVSSVPPVGSDCAVIFIGGDRSNGVVIATGNQGTRPGAKQPGETVVYGPNGSMVYLGVDGIAVNGGGKPVTVSNTPSCKITCDSVEITGDLLVDGQITAKGQVNAASVSATGTVTGSNIT